jgi:23S rRNA (adenine2030-N6)-methyltransferase
MNYKHAYHAGNFADVVKHAVLALVLEYFVKKDSGFCYIDTHAGEGLYDLSRAEMKRTKESQLGILRLLEGKTIPLLKPYLDALKPHFTEDNRLWSYPGSPFIAKHFMREQDRMILNEFHPDTHEQLHHYFRKEENTALHERDAHEFLPAILPPTPKRAVILIDPPFEKTSERRDIQMTLEKSLKRFPTACYLVWYPLTDEHRSLLLNKSLRKVLPAESLLFDFSIQNPPYVGKGMVGCAMAIINPPYVLADQLKTLLPYLWKQLSPELEGHWRIE